MIKQFVFVVVLKFLAENWICRFVFCKIF